MLKKQSNRLLALPADIEKVATHVVDSAFRVHSKLGPGLLESVYETCLAHELRKRELAVQRQIVLPVIYDDLKVERAFKIDLLVNECVVVEVKAIDTLLAVHKAQTLTYLKLTGHRLGLLINFNVPVVREGIFRIVL